MVGSCDCFLHIAADGKIVDVCVRQEGKEEMIRIQGIRVLRVQDDRAGFALWSGPFSDLVEEG